MEKVIWKTSTQLTAILLVGVLLISSTSVIVSAVSNSDRAPVLMNSDTEKSSFQTDSQTNPSTGQYQSNSDFPQHPVLRDQVFSPGVYAINFTEVGLPSNTTWKITIPLPYPFGPETLSTSGTVILTNLTNGTYNYTALTNLGPTALTEFGNFTINGIDENVTIVFPHPFYNLTINEVDPPYGADLWMSLHNANDSVQAAITTNNSSLTLLLPNGTYKTGETTNLGQENLTFHIEYHIFKMNGQPQNYSIIFPALHDVNVTVNVPRENEFWTIHFSGYTLGPIYDYVGNLWTFIKGVSTASRANYTLKLPNANYSYYLAFKYTPVYEPANPDFTINGTSINITADFPQTYKVTVTEVGFPLPPGNWWELVVVDNWSPNEPFVENVYYGNITGSKTVSFYLANYTYSYQVQSGPFGSNNTTIQVQSIIYHNFTVDGGPVNLTVLGLSVIAYKKVTFVVKDMSVSFNTQWNLTVNANYDSGGYNFVVSYKNWSMGDSMTAYLPNGSYNYQGTYFQYSSPKATFNLTGKSETVYVNFHFYPVTFKVSISLPNALFTVGVRGQILTYFLISKNSTTMLYLPNGTYYYQAYMSNLSILQRSFTVLGAPTTVHLNFPIYIISFNETGLPIGSDWTLDFNGSLYSTNSSKMTFVVTNGSYFYLISNTSKYTVSPNSAYIEIIGGNVSVDLTFQSIKKSNLFSGFMGFIESVYGALFLLIVIGGAVIILVINRVSKVSKNRTRP